MRKVNGYFVVVYDGMATKEDGLGRLDTGSSIALPVGTHLPSSQLKGVLKLKKQC